MFGESLLCNMSAIHMGWSLKYGTRAPAIRALPLHASTRRRFSDLVPDNSEIHAHFGLSSSIISYRSTPIYQGLTA